MKKQWFNPFAKQNSNNMSEEKNDGSVNETEQHELPNIPADEKDKRIAELEEQVAALNDKHIRLYSEFDNFRKRTAKERIEILNMAGAEVIKSLLPVIDDFERAIKNNENSNDIAAIKEGINLIAQKLRSVLMQKGLEPMNTVGEKFDPELHEAITNIPAPDPKMKGKIIEEVEKGYMLNGKIIRFAKVIVGS